MLADARRIQLDLRETFNIDKILMVRRRSKYERDSGAVFVDFSGDAARGTGLLEIDFYYSGHPEEIGRFGGMTSRKTCRAHMDYPSCEGGRASVWWPNKKTSGAMRSRALDNQRRHSNDLVDVPTAVCGLRPTWAMLYTLGLAMCIIRL